MKTETKDVLKILDKYEIMCYKRDNCTGCPYDRGESDSPWECFKHFLVAEGISQDIIELIEPVIDRKLSEDNINCCTCQVLGAETCITCTTERAIQEIEDTGEDEYVRVSDLRKAWNKFFSNTPYRNSLKQLLETVEIY